MNLVFSDNTTNKLQKAITKPLLEQLLNAIITTN
jgi:hypothetical protein